MVWTWTLCNMLRGSCIFCWWICLTLKPVVSLVSIFGIYNYHLEETMFGYIDLLCQMFGWVNTVLVWGPLIVILSLPSFSLLWNCNHIMVLVSFHCWVCKQSPAVQSACHIRRLIILWDACSMHKILANHHASDIYHVPFSTLCQCVWSSIYIILHMYISTSLMVFRGCCLALASLTISAIHFLFCFEQSFQNYWHGGQTQMYHNASHHALRQVHIGYLYIWLWSPSSVQLQMPVN